MEDTLTIYLEEPGEEERRRRRRRRIVAGLVAGVVLAAAAPPEAPSGGDRMPEVGVKVASVSVIRSEPAGPELPATDPPAPPDETPQQPRLPAKAVVSPARLDFGDGPLQRAPAARLAILRNDGGTPIDRITATAGSPFVVTNGCRPGLAPGAECAVAVVFAPAEAGTFRGTLEIAAAGRRSRIALRGGAAAPPEPPIAVAQPLPQPRSARVLCFDPPAITFLTRGVKQVTLRNREAEPLQIASIRILRNGAVSPGHRIETNDCLGILAPGGTCRFSVSPTREAMLLHETVQIAVDAVDPATGRTHSVHRDVKCGK